MWVGGWVAMGGGGGWDSFLTCSQPCGEAWHESDGYSKY